MRVQPEGLYDSREDKGNAVRHVDSEVGRTGSVGRGTMRDRRVHTDVGAKASGVVVMGRDDLSSRG